MKSWQEIITEAKSKREQELEKRVSELSDVPQSLKNGKKKDKGKDKKGKKSEYTKYLQKQLEYKKQKYEDQKKRQLEKLKEKGVESQKQKAKEALRGIKYQSISYKDKGATADAKAISNIGSALGGLAKAGYHGVRALQQKRKNELEAKKAKEKQPEKKEPQPGGRRAAQQTTQTQEPKSSTKPKQITGSPEPKKLVPATKRLVPSTKRLPPSGGVPETSRPKATTLGQRARNNPELKKRLIASRNQTESYSNWREEFEFIFEAGEKKEPRKKIIDVMKGKNKIIVNPFVTEEKDDEGGMAHSELTTLERDIKMLKKKIKSPNQQLPAWVQSKITKAADYIGAASDFIQSSKESVSEESDLNEIAPAIAGFVRVVGSGAARAGASKSLKTGMAQVAKDAALEKVKDAIQNKFTAGKEPTSGNSSDEIKKDEGESSAYKKAISNLIGMRESAAWTRKEGKNKEGGLNEKGRKSYERENPGSDLKAPSKKVGNPRRASFCARMSGMKKKLTSSKTANDPNSRINKSLRAWNC